MIRANRFARIALRIARATKVVPRVKDLKPLKIPDLICVEGRQSLASAVLVPAVHVSSYCRTSRLTNVITQWNPNWAHA